jgi:membrane protein
MRVERTEIEKVLRETFRTLQTVHPQLLAAGLSYFALFSLAPLLVVLVTFAGHIVSRPAAQQLVLDRINQWLTPDASFAVLQWLNHSATPHHHRRATVVGLALSAFAGSQVLGQMKHILNLVWDVKHPPRSMIHKWLRSGTFNIVMVAALGLLVVAGVVLDTGMAVVWQFFRDLLPTYFSQHGALIQLANFGLSLAVFAFLLALIYRYVPDTPVYWRDVRVGAAMTSLLLAVGKIILAIYFGIHRFKSIYGAAGSVFVLVFSLFVASNIFIFGAAFTRAWAEHYGSRGLTRRREKRR